MEVLIELLLEVLFEVIGSLIEEGFYALSDRYMSNTKAKRRAKFIIGSLIFVAVAGLVIYGLVTKRKPIVVAALAFILAIVTIRTILFFNGKDGKKWVNVLFGWVARVLHYGFATTIIVLSAIYVDGPVAKPVLIVCSSISIVVFFFIDLHKIRERDKDREQRKQDEKKKSPR